MKELSLGEPSTVSDMKRAYGTEILNVGGKGHVRMIPQGGRMMSLYF